MPDTIFARSTGGPPAAILIVRVSGPSARAAGLALAASLPNARTAAVRALIDPQSGEVIDHALVLWFDGPHSATGDDIVEFHCHGGRAVTEAVLTALAGLPGLRAAEPGEFTRRAFHNGRIDLTEAEGLADLLEAETEVQRRAAMLLAGGGLRHLIEGWRQRLLELSARIEHAIDYVGEDEQEVELAIQPDLVRLRAELVEWLSRPRIEPLREGVRVVIAGPPNVGKSSLLNALAGYDRAIVAPEAGTTRDHIDITLAVDGIPILLTDTAGLRSTDDQIEAAGVARSERLAGSADILLWLGERAPRPSGPRTIWVRSKSDLGEHPQDLDAAHSVSAKTGDGIGELLRSVAQQARDILPTEGEIALNARQAVILLEAVDALDIAANDDILLAAEGLRQARSAFDRITGRAGVDDFLDTLFGRFCLGK
ncbi:MAG: tRNA uridine-5-carboxymethylaminomethyl(34) synthesis GTPase MnmE [Sphingomicrobium sp.]